MNSGELASDPAMWLQQLDGIGTDKIVDLQAVTTCLAGQDQGHNKMSTPA